ncbi:MAG TPA: histidine kinase [Chitinophagaceae bacterium]|nr:histidine kinase [Chitinophagaceae bacterium]
MNLLDRLLAFHKKHRWLSHLIYWSAYLLVGVSSSKYRDGKEGTYSFEFTSDALYMFAEMIFAYALAYIVIPQFIYRKRYLLSAAVFLVASYTASATGRIFIVKICEPLAGVPPKAFETYKEILTDIPKLLYNYYVDMISAAAIFIFFKILKDQLIVQKRAMQLEKEKAESELKLLKTQLNPHFLFNTLNNIYALSLSSSPFAPKSIARLADILDHILYRCNGPFVPLQAEITLIQNYIELEKLRYDERLTVNFNADMEKAVDIAPLILLSLTENAFKHGASDDAGAPVIDINLRVTEKNFIFNISNTITNRGDLLIKTPGEGIGLINLRRQLDLVYGKDYMLEVTREDEYFRVQLIIQLNKKAIKHEKDSMLVG